MALEPLLTVPTTKSKYVLVDTVLEDDDDMLSGGVTANGGESSRVSAAAMPADLGTEIWISKKNKISFYITSALEILESTPSATVTLRALGNAVNKAITVAEIVKRRVLGLHQVTCISSSKLCDVYEPLEEGLRTVKKRRVVARIALTLSTLPLDTSLPGYQEPLDAELVKPRQDPTAAKPKAKPGQNGKGARRKRRRRPQRRGH